MTSKATALSRGQKWKEMGVEDALEEDDDDVDFNPYLQLSPSLDGASGDSSEVEDEVDGLEDDLEREVQEEGLNRESLHSLEKQSEGEKYLDEEDFVELGSDDYVEEDIEDEEQDDLVRRVTGTRGNWKLGDHFTQNDGKRALRPRKLGKEESNNEDANSSDGDAGVPKQDSEGDESPLLSGNLGSGKISDGLENETGAESPGPSIGSLPELRNFRHGGQSGEILRGNSSEDIGDDAIDAISKRTRAHYSLADMSLDQLEMFLQESDEEEYFQTVDDEEEYRKFLLAVQEQQDGGDEQSEHQGRKEDEDDEDEDADFEFEIEEALESDYDDASGFTRKRRRRRPETRENRRQRAKAQSKGTHLSQTKAPLRPLLPHTSSLSYSSSGKRNFPDGVEQVWAPNVKKKVPVNGFTAHQIGQLYCLIHEHVQLLVQVHAMCALEPSRQQIANDTRRMLMELTDKRDVLLSWKKTAFPDFCFKPPYTHPSFTEDEEETTTHRFQFPGDTVLANQETPKRDNVGVSEAFPSGSAALGPDHDLVSWKSVKSGTSSSSGPPSGQLNVLSSANLGRLPSLSLPKSAESTTFPRGHLVDMTHLWQQPFRASQIPEAAQTKLGAADGGSDQFRKPPLVQVGAYPGECSFGGQATARSLPPVTTTTIYFPNLCKIGTSRPAQTFSIYGNDGVKQADAIPEWAPATDGPVRTLLDVAPLALVREFLDDMSRVVEEYRQRHVESGAYHSQCEREPLFILHEGCFRRSLKPRTLLLSGECLPVSAPRIQIKKTMAAALVESTKKESLALVPRDVAKAVERFLPMFNPALFPHKPPPIAAANRLLFTDAEDELLAMGLMIYNTDWMAIQQRFLPSKTMHQIFVRQKNRSSARAPENPIKAVRRMKSSPLSAVEKARIQEGLKIYKYDWHKVWEFCVPHRDPAVLPRQWRIALGTQKSYKTSESSKERRRLYEANRRQAKKAMEYRPDIEKDTGQSSIATSAECPDVISGEEEEYGEGAFIRDAFLADWCPSKSPSVGASIPPSGVLCEERPKTKSSVPKKKKTFAGEAPDARPISSAHAVNLAAGPCTWDNRQALMFGAKQTVKLAPGLPSVKLPPHVQVLSRKLGPTLPPLSSSAGGESVLCRLPQITAQKWSRTTGPITDRTVLANPPQYFPSTFLPTSGGRSGLKASVQKHCSNPEPSLSSAEPLCMNPSQSMPQLNELPTATDNSTVTTTSVDPQRLYKDLDKSFGITQPSPSAVLIQVQNTVRTSADGVGTNGSAIMPSGEVQHLRGQKIYPSGTRYTGTKPKDLSSRKRKGGVPIAASSSSGIQNISSHLESVFTGSLQNSDIRQTCFPAVTSSQAPFGSDGQVSDSPSLARVNSERLAVPEPLSNEPLKALEPTSGGDAAYQPIADSPLETSYRATGQKGREVSCKGPLIKKSSAKSERKVENFKQLASRAKQDLDEQGAGSALHESTTCHTREDDHSLIHDALIVGEYRSTKQKIIETVETPVEDTCSEPQVIVMEQEELSDSEDEAGIGVEFEHEEMGDSDKDVEIRACNGLKDSSIQFEEEEMESDKEKEEDSLKGEHVQEKSMERLALSWGGRNDVEILRRDKCAEEDHGRLVTKAPAIAGAMTEVQVDCTYGKLSGKAALDPKGKPTRTAPKSKASTKLRGSELNGGSSHQVNVRRDRARKKKTEELETVVAAAEVLAVIRQVPASLRATAGTKGWRRGNRHCVSISGTRDKLSSAGNMMCGSKSPTIDGLGQKQWIYLEPMLLYMAPHRTEFR
ncbi:hypothetical protein R1flu_020202 [Riccia fluitans]|uniref:Uncharacterized protein n=1 Tax=Riccia fluitans TaxID=41844 RepID=A0ABD1ZPC9_9MARC